MIPYIIINGKNSKDVAGLMIQTLPHITKPAIRTEIEEIDGRDGDIITKLGYAAYDKEFTIGAFGNYNIDDIISFFSESGIICFSNEVDKIYKFDMINQIDFEKLLRYKTAVVTLHVQPFKYSAVDNLFKYGGFNLLNVKDLSLTYDDIELEVENNIIRITGEHEANKLLFIPIEPLTLQAGTYSITFKSNNETNVKGKLLTAATFDAPSLANAIELDGDATISGTIAEETTFKYILLILEDEAEEDFTLEVTLVNEIISSDIIVFNRGNVYAKPTLKLIGSGDAELYINNVKILDIAFGSKKEIIIKDMNAYNGDNLFNRYITGDYNNIKLKVGNNKINLVGNVESIELTEFSRWL